MTTTTNPELLTALFSAVADGDLSAVAPLADALMEMGRTGESAILRGEDVAEVYIVPAFELITSLAPDFSRDRKGHRNVLTVTEGGFGRIPSRKRVLRGKAMHHRTTATRQAFDRAVRCNWILGKAGRATVHVIDADTYDLVLVGE